jgi:predicted ATP-grasp superfamily ATP-dependent carboligase
VAVTGTAGGGAPLVLIGFAEAMAAIETAWSLQAAGFRVAAFGRAGRKPALRYVRGVTVFGVPAPEDDSAAAAGAIGALCASLSPAVLMPLDDHAVWACAQLDRAGAVLAGPDGLTAEYALDKSRQLEAAAKAGLAVPATQHVHAPAEAELPARFPVVVKPDRAVYDSGGALVRPTGLICADEPELRRALARPWPGAVLVQPLIAGTGEGLFGLAGPDGVACWSAHRRVRMVNPQGSASSACRSVPVDAELAGRGAQFVLDIGWRGLFMLEFLRDEAGQAWFMELNGRPWGSMALARRRGLEYPAWAARSALDPSWLPAAPPAAPHVVCRNVGLELVHLLFVARGPQTGAQVAWPRLGRSIREVGRPRRGDTLYNWKRSQPLVLAADTVGTLREYAVKMVRRRR